MCTVVNLRTHDYTIYCGRAGRGQPGPFGNHFIVGRDGARGECAAKFGEWLRSPAGAEMREKIKKVITVNDTLGCFCKPAACHADHIAQFVNNGFKF